MKKLTAMTFLAILVMALLFFAACSNNESGETEPTIAPPTAPDPAVQADSATSAEDDATIAGIHQPRDLGGAVLNVLGNHSGIIWFSQQFDDEPDPATAINYYFERMIWDNARRVEEEFNFTINEIVTEYGYKVPMLTASVMAGDSIAEVFRSGGSNTMTSILGNLIIPINEINLPNSDVLGPQVYASPMAIFQDQIWTIRPNIPYNNALSVGVNLDIVNAIGAPNPVDLYYSGQWTWDAMLNIMRMATADTTGDGTIDRFGFAGQPPDLIGMFIGANDGPMVTEDFRYAFDHPNTIEALEFVETIFAEGHWQTCPQTGSIGDWGTNFFGGTQGRAAMWKATPWALSGGDLPFEFAIVPFPSGPSSARGSTGIGGWVYGAMLPASSSWAPEDVLMVLEEYFAWPGDQPDYLYEEALTWIRSIMPTEGDVQRQLSILYTRNFDIGMIVPTYFWFLGDFAQYFMYQEMTIMQGIETHRGPMQELLDTFLAGGN